MIVVGFGRLAIAVNDSGRFVAVGVFPSDSKGVVEFARGGRRR